MNTIIQMMFLLSKKIKGFIRKITSPFPITCPDCVDEDSLINMSIEGNCYQDGEPTYDNPIEIQSVGERTENLLVYPYPDTTVTRNGITFIDNGDGTITANGTATAGAYFTFNAFSAAKRQLLKAGTYIISGNPTSYHMGLYLYNNADDSSATAVKTPINDKSVTFTIDTDMYYYWYISVTSGTSLENVTFSPMLRKADTEVDGYEPYGYKIPIVAETENLFDLSLVHKDLRDTLYSVSGVSSWGGHVITTDNVHTIIRPGKTYTLSYDMECLKLYDGATASVTTGLSVHSATLGHIFSQSYLRRRMTIGEKVHISVTATIPDNFDEIVATMLLYTGYYKDDAGNIIPADTIRFTNIKIEEADHETEPIVSNVYLKEPMNYKDVMDINAKTLTRNYNRLALGTGCTMGKYSGGVLERPGVYIQGIGMLKSSRTKGFFTHAVSTPNASDNIWFGYGNSHIYVLNEEWYNMAHADFLAWLDEQKANGTPVEIVYPLEEPITEKIIAPNLPTFKHGTTYSIATTVQPLSGTVEYYSTTKGV